jgi:hypothetical protein
MQTRTNGNGHKTRKSWKVIADLRPESLALALLKAPGDVETAQRHFDASRIELEGHVAAIAVRALTEPIFRVKAKEAGEEDSWRAAGNDQERKLAVEQTLHLDATYIELRVVREANARDLELCRNRLKAILMAAKLVIGK